MGAAYSQDLRDRVLRAYQRGMRTAQIAEVFDISPAWARRVKQRLIQHGEASPRKTGSPGVRKFDRGRLAHLVREHPDATLKELRDLLGVQCAESAICTSPRALFVVIFFVSSAVVVVASISVGVSVTGYVQAQPYFVPTSAQRL